MKFSDTRARLYKRTTDMDLKLVLANGNVRTSTPQLLSPYKPDGIAMAADDIAKGEVLQGGWNRANRRAQHGGNNTRKSKRLRDTKPSHWLPQKRVEIAMLRNLEARRDAEIAAGMQ